MSDEVMARILQLAHERHTDSPDPLCPRCLEEWRTLRAQLAEANTRIETLTHRLEAAEERAEAWEEAALGKTGKQSFDEMERSWRETVARAEEVEFESDNLRDTCIDYEAKIDGLVAARDELKRQLVAERKFHDQATNKQIAFVCRMRERRKEVEAERDELQRKLDACQCETRVLNESMLIEARQERDQLAAECGLLREALIWASAADDFSPGGEGGFLPGKAREGFEKIVLPALAATPHAAKAAERVKVTGDVLKIARKATTARWDLIGGMPSQVEDLRDALDRLDAVDKPKEEEALK